MSAAAVALFVHATLCIERTAVKRTRVHVHITCDSCGPEYVSSYIYYRLHSPAFLLLLCVIHNETLLLCGSRRPPWETRGARRETYVSRTWASAVPFKKRRRGKKGWIRSPQTFFSEKREIGRVDVQKVSDPNEDDRILVICTPVTSLCAASSTLSPWCICVCVVFFLRRARRETPKLVRRCSFFIPSTRSSFSPSTAEPAVCVCVCVFFCPPFQKTFVMVHAAP